jgi:hypothetical protein
MKHLYFIVEGETELEFVNRLLKPYLWQRGLTTHIQALPITMGGGGHGYNNIQHFKNTIKPLLNYGNEPFITTMIDYYGINSEKKMPNYAECMTQNTTDDKIKCMENSLQTVVKSIKQYRFFIPYIQKHEMETLLFANPAQGFDLEKPAIKNAVLALIKQNPDIETINNTPQGAPSKRLTEIYAQHGQKYNKGADAVDIAELTGMDNMLKECPRFRNWVERLIAMFSES